MLSLDVESSNEGECEYALPEPAPHRVPPGRYSPGLWSVLTYANPGLDLRLRNPAREPHYESFRTCFNKNNAITPGILYKYRTNP